MRWTEQVHRRVALKARAYRRPLGCLPKNGGLHNRRSRVPGRSNGPRGIGCRTAPSHCASTCASRLADEPYTCAVVLSGSFGRLSPSSCSPSAAWADNANRRCIRRATPSPSPDIDEGRPGEAPRPERRRRHRRPERHASPADARPGVARLLHAGRFDHDRRPIISRFGRSQPSKSRGFSAPAQDHAWL